MGSVQAAFISMWQASSRTLRRAWQTHALNWRTLCGIAQHVDYTARMCYLTFNGCRSSCLQGAPVRS
jgi:hypothetical protein